MSNIPTYLPLAQQPAGTAPSQAVIPAPPPGLARLSAGTLIDGIVIGRTQQGLLAVKTSHGELALRTSASPPVQSRVVLQLQPSGGQFRVILLSAPAREEGAKTAQATPAQKPAASPPRLQQAPSQPPAPSPQARTAPAQVSAAQLAQAQASAQSTARAIVTPQGPPSAQTPPASQPGAPPPNTAPSQSPSGPTTPGQALPAAGRPGIAPATLGAANVPAAPSGGVPAAPAAPAPAAALPTAPGNAAAPATASAPSGTPATPTPTATPTATPGAGPGTTGLPNPGLSAASPPVASGQSGRIGQVAIQPGGIPPSPAGGQPALPGALSLSGSSLPLPAAAGPSAAGAAIAGTGTGAELIRSWPGLDQAIATLRAASPQFAATNIDPVMPRPGPQLAGTIALLVSALRGGDIRGWLGQATMREVARTSGKESSSRLSDDFGQLSRLARTDSGEWRVHALPFFDGARHQQIQLYIKQREQSAAGEEEPPARFVFEFDLSNLGPVQLDGLAANHRFDLMVRSQTELPGPIRKEISALFSRAQEESGFAGEIHFQTVPTFIVPPHDEHPPVSGGLVV